MSNKSASRYPHVVFKRIKKFAEVNKPEREEATEFILRVDGTHGQESAILNYVKDGCLIVGHNNLNPAKHGNVISLIDGLTNKIDPRLLADKPESVIENKVKNERSRQA